MIIARTPIRISFCGGGTDLPAFYENYGSGMVVSSTINKYIHVLVHKRFDDMLRFTSFKEELVDKVEEMEEGIVKTALKKLGVEKGIDLIAISDVPPGTGMGSSGAFTVSLLKALYAYTGKEAFRGELAEEACKIEIEDLKQPVGKQDQYAAAYGGFATFEFGKDGTVKRQDLNLSHDLVKNIEDNSLMLFLKKERSASNILKEQVANMDGKNRVLAEMKEMVPDMVAAIEDGNAQGMGKILHRNWELKKGLAASITDPYIDDLYTRALESGAYGGKVLGAGGGGFLFLMAPPEKHSVIKKNLDLDSLGFVFEEEGSILV
jgi:D-glycero-alpha-D-manno-heptose-7-phosphate kinase